jgi:hypothetical protein
MRWMITPICDFACYLLAPLPFVLLRVFIAGIRVSLLSFV